MSVGKTPLERTGARASVLKLAQVLPVVRARDAAAAGVHTGTLTRMARAGQLERIGAGRYRLPTTKATTERYDILVAATAVPTAVVCLLSALRFHEIGTQLPHQVWLSVPRGMRVPTLASPPIRIVSISPKIFSLGVEVHRVENQAVRVYSIARTVADCFRFRNAVGLDVALEALSEAWRSKRLQMDELNRIAKKLRIQRVLQPYVETIVL